MTMSHFLDPDAVLDYAFDWKAATHGHGGSDWLAEGELIESHEVVSANVTIDSHAESDGIVTVWVSGAVVDSTARITCRITTNEGRTDDRTIAQRVLNR